MVSCLPKRLISCFYMDTLNNEVMFRMFREENLTEASNRNWYDTIRTRKFLFFKFYTFIPRHGNGSFNFYKNRSMTHSWTFVATTRTIFVALLLAWRTVAKMTTM